MRTLFTRTILLSAFALASLPLFGRGESAREFRYSRISFQGSSPVRGYCLGARSGGYVMSAIYSKGIQEKVSFRPNPGAAAFRK
jgi:hypothetical protein